MFKVTIDTSNAAFEDGVTEITRLLREIIYKLNREYAFQGILVDINGAKVGTWDAWAE